MSLRARLVAVASALVVVGLVVAAVVSYTALRSSELRRVDQQLEVLDRRVLSKTQLLEHVWEYDFGGDPNILETYISYLRKKLNAAGPPMIQTVRGVGYSLRLAG